MAENIMDKKVVLITGGATGIGREIAMVFAAKNFKVVINYNSSFRQAKHAVNQIRGKGGEAFKISADISNRRDVARLFSAVKKRFKRLDVLINNAGWTKFVDYKRADKITDKLFQRIMDVNVKGVFLCSCSAQELMKKSYMPVIINIASLSGIDGIGSNIIYCASKAAVICLTKSLARSFSPHIRVNALAPGYVKTNFIKSVPREFIRKSNSDYFPGKIIMPRDVAAAAFSLYENNNFLTGETLIIK
jgi:3-oxoacyl-[acyl-carrier protein] reductase